MSAKWFRRFAACRPFPRDYTTVDIETNGTSVTNSYICSIGHTVVRDCVPVETAEVLLNWPSHPGIELTDFRDKLEKTQVAMEAKGKGFFHNWERLRDEGRPPLEVLTEYLARFEDMEARREVLIAHNGWCFDMEMLQAHFHNHLCIPFLFDPNLVFDSGIMVKASQLDERDLPMPQYGETLKAFARRMSTLRRRDVFWALDGYCNNQYQLFEKAGISKELAHGAGTDSLLVHHLFEHQRHMASLPDEGANGEITTVSGSANSGGEVVG